MVRYECRRKEKRERKKKKRIRIDSFIFSLGGTGHPPTTNYCFLIKPNETVFAKKLHANAMLIKWLDKEERRRKDRETKAAFTNHEE